MLEKFWKTVSQNTSKDTDNESVSEINV